MPPGKLRKDTLSELRKARNDMTSIEWLTKVEQLSEAEQTAAAKAKLNVSLAIRKLENAQLAEIRQQLVVNEKELQQGITKLNTAAKELNNIKPYMNAVTSLLQVVGTIVKLL